MAEMAVIPAIYRRYRTKIAPGFEGKSPGIVSRVEVFGDETFDHVEVSDYSAVVAARGRHVSDRFPGTYMLGRIHTAMTKVSF